MDSTEKLLISTDTFLAGIQQLKTPLIIIDLSLSFELCSINRIYMYYNNLFCNICQLFFWQFFFWKQKKIRHRGKAPFLVPSPTAWIFAIFFEIFYLLLRPVFLPVRQIPYNATTVVIPSRKHPKNPAAISHPSFHVQFPPVPQYMLMRLLHRAKMQHNSSVFLLSSGWIYNRNPILTSC